MNIIACKETIYQFYALPLFGFADILSMCSLASKGYLNFVKGSIGMKWDVHLNRAWCSQKVFIDKYSVIIYQVCRNEIHTAQRCLFEAFLAICLAHKVTTHPHA